MYIVLYRFKKPGDKSPGPVVQYRLEARNLAEAWQMARRYLNYEGAEIVDVGPV
jgi:hypothetical protein